MQELADERVIAGRNRLVGIERQNPVTRCVGKGGVARPAEVVLPRDMKHPRATRLRDRDGAIRAAGIDEHDLVGERAHRFEAAGEIGLFIPGDQADRQGRQ